MSDAIAISARRREIYDFAVIGDGPVGLASALALGQSGYSVVLIAPTAAVPAVVIEAHADLRVYALAPDMLAFLATLGCALSTARACTYQSMRVFDADATNTLEFQASDYGWAELGRIVEHQVLQAELWAQLASGTVKFLHGHVERYQVEDAVGVLHTTSDTVRAHWVLDASGAGSKLRATAGISVQTHDYQQSAIITHVHTEKPHAHTAWQRFTADGTIALLPMFDTSHALVYSALQAKADALLAMPPAEFLSDLAYNFGDRLGRFTAVAERRKIPLQRQLSARYLNGRLILLGDSGHSVHPLAGQGLNMGLRDVACLLRLLNHASELPVAEQSLALGKFERERKSENAITAYGIEALQKLFLPSSGPLKLLRNLGLRGVNRLIPLKRLFAELAAGKVAGWPG
jgi:ubiquinone biosynthesis UbiH/UbiF/VisC/COQ6 family hydroxylase